MSETINLKYQSLQDIENNSKPSAQLLLNAWNVQNIVYELVVNNFLMNTPESLGFAFTQKFDLDRTNSEILVDIAYNWKPEAGTKRPAIFIQRGKVTYEQQTMGGWVGGNNLAESEFAGYGIATLPIMVKCIATNIGFTEQLAEYVKQPLLHYQRIIQTDFKFQQFRLLTVGAPEIYVESKEHFQVVLGINTVFAEGWILKRDDLKLKTVSKVIFDNVTSRPITNQ
jgi:hypothetical protein